MHIDERLNHINRVLEAVSSSWAAIACELQDRIDAHIESLVSSNSEETRGRIKALRDLLNLPETLQFERDGINAALSEQSDAAL